MAVPSEETAFKILAMLDTVHDFYKERGTATEGDDDVSEEKMGFIRGFIADTIRNYIETDPVFRVAPFAAIPPVNPDKGTDLLNLVKHITLGEITSLASKFEPNVVSLFEQWYPFELSSQTKREETFTSILANYAAKNVEYDRLRNISDVLVITREDGTSFGQLSPLQLNQLSNFILHYFYGNIPAASSFTFDGKGGTIANIFRNIDQTFSIIFPQTIADSAPTNFTPFNGRNIFKFPNVGGTIDAVSNIYTKGEYTISYVNNGFTDKNQFGFLFQIRRGGQTVDIPFSAKATSGPSVNYLISLLQKARSGANLAAAETKKAGILRIGDYIPQGSSIYQGLVNPSPTTNSLPLDVKRTGDNEQLEACKAVGGPLVFCSIDHLSILYARMKKQNCMFHVGEDKLVLFRFATEALDPVQQESIAAFWKASKAADMIQTMQAVLSQNVPGILLEQSKKFFEARNATAEDPLTTLLLRMKMNDIFGWMLAAGAVKVDDATGNVVATDALNVALDAGQIETIRAAVSIQQSRLYTPDELGAINIAVNAVTVAYKSLFSILNGLDITLKPGKTVVTLKDITFAGRFLKNRMHELFKYNSVPFTSLQKNIQNINNIRARVASGRYRNNKDILEILTADSYFNSVNAISAQFFNTTIGERISNIFNVDTRTDGVAVVDRLSAVLSLFGPPGVVPTIINDVQTLYGEQGLPALVMVGGARTIEKKLKTKGIQVERYNFKKGLKSPIQYDMVNVDNIYIELNDLLRKLCAIATRYIEGVYVELQQPAGAAPISVVSYMQKLMNDNDSWHVMTRKTIEDIVLVWETGLNDLNRSDYVIPGSMSHIISYFLSFLTVGVAPDGSIVRDNRLIFEDPSLRRRAVEYYNRIANGMLQVPIYPEVFQLMVLHGLHFTFENSPAYAFKESVFKPARDLNLLVTREYNTQMLWEEWLYNDLMKVCNTVYRLLAPSPAPHQFGGARRKYHGTRKQKQNRRGSRHVGRRTTSKR